MAKDIIMKSTQKNKGKYAYQSPNINFQTAERNFDHPIKSLYKILNGLQNLYLHVKKTNKGGITYEIMEHLNELEDKINSTSEAILILKHL